MVKEMEEQLVSCCLMNPLFFLPQTGVLEKRANQRMCFLLVGLDLFKI